MKIFIVFLFPSIFADLIGQNRLGNNRWVSKISRNRMTQDTYLVQLLAQLTKTKEGRKIVAAYIKKQPAKKRNNQFGRRVNYRKFAY